VVELIVAEKPQLDNDLLVHFGVKGMHWGVRKPEDPLVGNRPQMSRAKKVAVGVGVAAAATTALYIIAKSGQSPKTAAFSSKSNRAGMKIAGKLLGKLGKASYQTVPKVAKGTGKVGFKVATVSGKGGVKVATAAGRGTARGIAKGTTTSATKTLEGGRKSIQAIARAYRNVELKRALRNSPETIQAGSNFFQRQLRRRVVTQQE
jgi:hypothetical protein